MQSAPACREEDDPRQAARPAHKQVIQFIAGERVVCEHGFAYLRAWRILTKLRFDPARATHLLRALLVRTCHHITRSQMITAILINDPRLLVLPDCW